MKIDTPPRISRAVRGPESQRPEPAGVERFMDNLDTFPGIGECIFCYGPVRPAIRSEVAERLRGTSPEFRAAVEQSEGTWYVCPGAALSRR